MPSKRPSPSTVEKELAATLKHCRNELYEYHCSRRTYGHHEIRLYSQQDVANKLNEKHQLQLTDGRIADFENARRSLAEPLREYIIRWFLEALDEERFHLQGETRHQLEDKLWHFYRNPPAPKLEPLFDDAVRENYLRALSRDIYVHNAARSAFDEAKPLLDLAWENPQKYVLCVEHATFLFHLGRLIARTYEIIDMDQTYQRALLLYQQLEEKIGQVFGEDETIGKHRAFSLIAQAILLRKKGEYVASWHVLQTAKHICQDLDLPEPLFEIYLQQGHWHACQNNREAWKAEHQKAASLRESCEDYDSWEIYQLHYLGAGVSRLAANMDVGAEQCQQYQAAAIILQTAYQSFAEKRFEFIALGICNYHPFYARVAIEHACCCANASAARLPTALSQLEREVLAMYPNLKDRVHALIAMSKQSA